MSQNESAWKAVEADLDLYKFYLEVTLKAAAFALTITGAIVSFYLANVAESALRFALAVPLVLAAGFAYLFRASIPRAQALLSSHVESCDKAGIREYDLRPLEALLRILFYLHSLVATGLLILLLWGFPATR